MASHLQSSTMAAIAVALLAACGSKQSPPAGAVEPPPTVQTTKAVNAMEILDLEPGTGATVVGGNTAVVQYTGWLYEHSAPDKKGKEFDSSLKGGQPFSFVVGAGQVIKGWDQGILGMKVGGRRRLTIPPDLGYGDVGAGGVIPPGATLVFDVALVAVE